MDQLGAALRAWRDRLDPVTVGFAHGSPRRVPGLRRTELATLAGISVEYVVRLEQGRVATPQNEGWRELQPGNCLPIRASQRTRPVARWPR
ncbi:helix-turn-helix domain-containing protein [Kitasatospora sp. NPDC001683]